MSPTIITVGPTVGSAGAAVAEAYTFLVKRGRVSRVCVEKVSGTPPNTTDLTLKTLEDDAGVAMTLLEIPNNQFASPAWFFPVQVANLAADATALAHWIQPVLDNKLHVAIAQCDSGVTLKLTIYFEE